MNFLNKLPLANTADMQTTIRDSVTFSGIGIHNGKAVNLKLLPTNVDTGIVFRRVDLKKNNEIKVSFNNIVRSKFCSKIVNNHNVSVSTVEHLMSALKALSIDNVIIELDAPELPAMDGSAYEYTSKLLKSGKKYLNKNRKYLKIKNKVSTKIGQRWISISPSEKLTINVEIDYPNTLIGNDNYDYTNNENNFVNEICFARTFTLLKDVNKLRASGFGIGGNTNNALVVDEYNLINKSGLRCPHEFTKHKILDCLGDLYLSGYNIIGELMAYAPGHELNYQLLEEVFKNKENYEILDTDLEFKEDHIHNNTLQSFNVA